LSGLIKASGDIEEQEKGTEPFVKVVKIQPNNYKTIASSYPQIFTYFCLLCIAIICIPSLIKIRTKNDR